MKKHKVVKNDLEYTSINKVKVGDADFETLILTEKAGKETYLYPVIQVYSNNQSLNSFSMITLNDWKGLKNLAEIITRLYKIFEEKDKLATNNMEKDLAELSK